MNKKSLITLVVVAILLLGVFMYKKSQAPTTQDMLPAFEENNNTTVVAPMEMPIAEKTEKTYTLTEVATYNQPSDCLTAINGQVYNLTAWINKHPGGDKAILSICGKDGSAAFNGQHGGKTKQANILAGFEVGILAQ
jgi:cytochrome b involved in lipid metabolism